jgi:hypothetical protein
MAWRQTLGFVCARNHAIASAWRNRRDGFRRNAHADANLIGHLDGDALEHAFPNADANSFTDPYSLSYGNAHAVADQYSY